jgi:hypothetical protein
MLDHGVSSFPIPLKPLRWYIRAVTHLEDVVGYNLWQVAQCHITSGEGGFYLKFASASGARHNRDAFQEALGNDLIRFAQVLCITTQTSSAWQPARLRTPAVFKEYASAAQEAASSQKRLGMPFHFTCTVLT